MGNFALDTAVEKITNNQFTATLSRDWEIWGPNGGYVASIALRAVEASCWGMEPGSMYCQYLSVAQFAKIDIQVECIKPGRNAMAFSVTMRQQNKNILYALIWVSKSVSGLEHHFVELPTTWLPLDQAPSEDSHWQFAFWNNFNVRALQPSLTPTRKASNAIAANWYRFKSEMDLNDPFLNAARAVVLIDTMQWPATTLAYDEGSLKHIAPSLDLYLQFHHNRSQSQWLFSEARSDIAERGIIGGGARVWDQSGRLLASGGSQLLCVPSRNV